MKLIIIKEDGGYEIIRSTAKPGLEELQRMVGGMIEWVALDEKLGFYINEEGKINNLKINTLASAYWNQILSKMGYKLTDYIAGKAVLLGTDDEGESCSLSEEAITDFTDFADDFVQMTK